MFEDIGAKLKSAAVVLCILGIIASVIGAVALWVQDDRYVDTIGPGIVVLLSGCAGSLISAMMLYGFGQLIENSDMQVTLLRKVERQLSMLREESAPEAKSAAAPAAQAAFVPKASREKRWKCKECGYDYNVEGKTSCDICGSCR